MTRPHDERRRGDDRFAWWAASALIAAAAQFVLLSLVAMLFYAGGSAFDTTAEGYAFFHNFFSDLGMSEPYGGGTNTVAMVLFIWALACVGVALIWFGLAVPRLREAAPRSRGVRWAAAVAPVAAAISGVSYVGIAFTPHDLYPAAHEQFVNVAFGFLLVFVLCLAFLEVRAGWPRRLVIPNVVYAVLLAVYVYLLFWGPSTDYERGLVTQVVAQKVIVYSSIVNLGWQALGFRRSSWQEATPHAAAELVRAPAEAD